jgi:hypothetical protein
LAEKPEIYYRAQAELLEKQKRLREQKEREQRQQEKEIEQEGVQGNFFFEFGIFFGNVVEIFWLLSNFLAQFYY